MSFHASREYCLQSTVKQDAIDLRSRISRRMKNLFRRKGSKNAIHGGPGEGAPRAAAVPVYCPPGYQRPPPSARTAPLKVESSAATSVGKKPDHSSLPLTLHTAPSGDSVVDALHGGDDDDDERHLIRSLARNLTDGAAGAGASGSGSLATMVVSLDAQHSAHLLQVLDTLDAENRTVRQKKNPKLGGCVFFFFVFFFLFFFVCLFF
jgi:hypothetical protein